MSSKQFEYIEHTADLRFRSYGKTLGECFSNAAKAMFNAIVDSSTVKAREVKTINLSSQKLELLMHDYLSEVLFYFEDEGLLFSDFKVEVKEKNKGFELTGTLRGEKFDPKRHMILTEIKAVTYHEMKIKEEKGIWSAEILCDI
jgi:SHS2 domain-containing protein